MKHQIDRIISLIFETRKMMHESKEGKTDKSCSFMHLITLKYMHEKSPLMKELADFLGIAPPSATSLVNTLAKSSFVKRENDKNDRRIVRIVITGKGKKYLEIHREKITENMREKLQRLNEKEQTQLLGILEKINK